MLFRTRPRVLCVDDDEDSRVMLTMLLKLAFIESKAVGTATQALALIQAEHFDLYLIDAWLPEVDGFELCRRLRAFDAKVPILFFSGAAFEADKRKAFEAGADDYVIKPNISELVTSLKQFVSRDPQQPVAREVRPGALSAYPASVTSVLTEAGPQLSLANLERAQSSSLIF